MTRSRDTANIIPTVDAKGDLLVGTADNAIDNLPAGTNGTYLKANSASATGLEWGTGVESIVDAKGDLLVGTADNTVDNLSPGTNGQVLTANSATATGLQWTTPASTGNVLMNGGFDIWQRGTSPTWISNNTFNIGPDRWYAISPAGRTHSRVDSGLAGFQYAVRYQRTAGNTDTLDINAGQVLETIHSIPLAGKAVTLSFYARKGANYSAGNLLGAVVSGAGIDQNYVFPGFSGAAIVASGSLALTTDWQRFTTTGTVSSSATQLVVRIETGPFSGTAGANDWFEITGVQLEAGTVATPFRRNAPSIQAELAACQRYYYRNTPGTSYGRFSVGYAESTTRVRSYFQFPVTMRSVVSSIEYGGTLMLEDFPGGVKNISNILLNSGGSGKQGASVLIDSSSLTQFRPYDLLSNNNSASFIGFSAEL
jgi:hypothetical protein